MFRLKKKECLNWQISSAEPLLNGGPEGNISNHERLLLETIIHDGGIV